MSRTIHADLLTALAQPTVKPFYAVDLEFTTSSPIYLWTGVGDLSLNGNTYLGAGDLMGVGGLGEEGDMTAAGATLTFSGVPASLVAIALAEPIQNRICKIYLGCEGETETVELFTGLMDNMPITDTANGATITLTVESKLIDLERPRVLRYTQESQKNRYSADTFFSYVADLQDKQILWGRSE